MRILEPHHLQRRRSRRQRMPFKRWLLMASLYFGVVLAAGYLLFGQSVRGPAANKTEDTTAVAPTVTEQPRQLKEFSADEFKAAYNTYRYPNTQLIVTPPTITGDDEADARVRKIAEARGYKLTAVPVSSIVKTEEPNLEGDDLIQPNALIAWQDLKQAADKDGIPIRMTSAYRSISYQRSLFVQRLYAAGVNVGRILEGYADDEIAAVLSRAAPPGYSRHHTGYTIDLSCNGVGLEQFNKTACYTWLSANNFEQVKKFGWVPSYPEGVGTQGPEPESWEYVWVGTTSTYE